MSFSAKFQYACLAMLELARNEHTGEPLQLRRIAERHSIPQQFLVQIVQDLKRAGLVQSTRGAAGGYRLSLPANEVSLADVCEVVEGGEREGSASPPTSPSLEAIHRVSDDIASAKQQRLSEATLDKLVEESCPNREPMWYI